LFKVMALGAIPIINDNDAISTEEIDARFTDNDELAIEVARAIQAHKVIILSGISGLFTDNPEAKKLAEILVIDDTILAMANGKSSLGTGGMRSKLQAIDRAMQDKIEVCLTYGKLERAILRAFEIDFQGTRFGVKN